MGGNGVLGIGCLAADSRCHESVREVNGRSFMQLMQSPVKSVLFAEIWDCHQKLDGLNQLQLRALRSFFGAGVRHAPKGIPDDSG